MSGLPQRGEVWHSDGAAARSPLAGLVLWSAGNALLLGAIWTDLRISAGAGGSAGRLGMPFLLAGQVMLSAVLCADIARTFRAAVLAFAIAFPLAQLAGWRCAAGAGVSLTYSAALAVWIAGLLGWMTIGRSGQARTLIVAGLVMWVVGTPLLWYVLSEFAPMGVGQRVIASASPGMVTGNASRLLIVAAIHAAAAGAWVGTSYLRHRGRSRER